MCSWSTGWISSISAASNPITLYPLQFANCDRLEHHDALYIFDEVGCGKTIMSGLMALHYLYHNTYEKDCETASLDKKVLVITTPTLAAGGWHGQFLKDWDEKLPFSQLHLKSQVHITNNHHSNLKNLASYGLVILDEAHMFLNKDTDRYKSLLNNWHRQYNPIKSEKVLFLTATPIKSGFEDLHRYVEIAREMLHNKGLPDGWIGQLKDWQKIDEPVCARFDLDCPVTRYFKDTQDQLKSCSKHTPKRCPPLLWKWDESTGGKNQALLRELLKIRENDKNRCVIFVRYVEGESGAKQLYKYLTGQTEDGTASGSKDRLTCFREDEVAVVTGQYCNPPCNGQSEISPLAPYESEDTQKLPWILIVTYQIAEAGVNLPGFNYVINYHIPSYPSALEQRLGRIDRLGSGGSESREIHMCYLKKRKHPDLDTVNFHSAIGTYLSDLIPYLPVKNGLLSREILEEHFSAEYLFNHFENQMNALLENQETLSEAYNTYKHYYEAYLQYLNIKEFGNGIEEPNLECYADPHILNLLAFCKDYDLFDGEFSSTQKFKKAVKDKIVNIKYAARFNLSPEIKNRYLELLAPAEDNTNNSTNKIFFTKDSDAKDILDSKIDWISVENCADGIKKALNSYEMPKPDSSKTASIIEHCRQARLSYVECLEGEESAVRNGLRQGCIEYKPEMLGRVFNQYKVLANEIEFSRADKARSRRSFNVTTKAVDIDEAAIRALYRLGLFYRMGGWCGVDLHIAADYFEKAAICGYKEAQYEYGCCFRPKTDMNGDQTSNGRSPNLEAAVDWWKKSAEQGYAPAQAELGDHYRSRDIGKAVEYYERAATQEGYWTLPCKMRLVELYEKRSSDIKTEVGFLLCIEIIRQCCCKGKAGMTWYEKSAFRKIARYFKAGFGTRELWDQINAKRKSLGMNKMNSSFAP